MEGETSAVVEAAASAAAQTQALVEHQHAVVESVIESAQQQVAAAERTAEQIAAAAMESARGEEINRLQREIEECRAENRNLSGSLAQVTEQLATLSGQVAALLTLEIIQAAMTPPSVSAPASSSLTLPNLEEAATQAAQELDPSNLAAVAEAAHPAPPQAPAKRKQVI